MSHLRFMLLIGILSIGPSQLDADIAMVVRASPAPNFFGSSNWSGYLSNAMDSLENDLGDIGDRTLSPTAYEIFEAGELVLPRELIVTGFTSWRGEANPPVPFSNEYGNRVHFGVHIVGDGVTRFRLEDLSYEIASEDGNQLGFTGNFAGSNYSSTRLGIDYGPNQVKGGGDDVIINSGSSTQFIDEFIYVGVGNAYVADSQSGPSDQEKLDQTISAIAANAYFDVTGTYRLTDSAGSTVLATNSTSFTVVPEPFTGWILLGLGGVAARTFRRRITIS